MDNLFTDLFGYLIGSVGIRVGSWIHSGYLAMDGYGNVLGMEKERDENSEEILFDNVYILQEVIGK